MFEVIFFRTVAALAVLLVAAAAWRAVRRVFVVEAWQQGLRYRDGAFVETLAPGRHVFADPRGRNRVVLLPRHPLAGSVGPVDVVSRDGFGYRVTLGYSYVIADARRYQEESGGIAPALGGSVPLAGFADRMTAAAMVRAAALILAEAQADPQRLAADLPERLTADYPALRVEAVTVTRVTLPPEVRKLLTEVERARLEGLAALERARSEGAALRSLANAARLVRDNPELAQLRLLQAIETAKRAPTIVLGQAPPLPPTAEVAPAGPER